MNRALVHAATVLVSPAYGAPGPDSEVNRTDGFWSAAAYMPFARLVAERSRRRAA